MIATPAGYYLMKQLLRNIYAYHAPITARPFVYTLIILTLTALLTTAWQVYRTPTANPVDMLRIE